MNKCKKKKEWSKVIILIGVLMGFIIAQECFFLMLQAITAGYAATATWLTAGVALAQAVIIACISGYLSLCKVDHSIGGITYETAKAVNFEYPEEGCSI